MLSTTRLEPLGKQILDEPAELPAHALLQQGDFDALMSMLAKVGSDLLEVPARGRGHSETNRPIAGRRCRSLEADADVRTWSQVDGVHEANVPVSQVHQQRLRPGAVSEESHALQQGAIGDTGSRKDDVPA